METIGLRSFDHPQIQEVSKKWFFETWYPLLDSAYRGLEEALDVSDGETKMDEGKVHFEAHSLRATDGDNMSKERKEVHHITQVVDKLAHEMRMMKKSTSGAPHGGPSRKVTSSDAQGALTGMQTMFPEALPGCRIPDDVAVPTCTTQSVTRFEIASAARGASNSQQTVYIRNYPDTSTKLS